MYRFFLAEPFAPLLRITGSDAHHISHVLRMKKGEALQIVSLDQVAAVMKITAFGEGWVEVALDHELTEAHEPTVRITLIQGLPKQDKMEWVIQKAVELGVTEILPAMMEHSVVRIDAAKAARKTERWQKIAEAAAMCRDRKRRVTLISGAANPDTINTVRTYCYGTNDELRVVPTKDGKTDLDALKEMLTPDVASVYIQQPNFNGLFEDAEAIGEAVHEAGAMYVMGCNPTALGIMKTPKDCGADVAVGEAQPLGMPLSYGGPYLGFMATTNKHMRKLPGRIIGETVDSKGDRAYCLALQAREQHIRREKASSNICSNEALCALIVGVYCSAVGPDGLASVATQSMSKAHYLAKELCKIPGISMKYTGEFFHEFVVEMPKVDEVLKALEEAGILGGLPVEGGVLWCATEKASKAVLDKTVAIVKEVCAK